MDQPTKSDNQAAELVETLLQEDLDATIAGAAAEVRERAQELEDRIKVSSHDLSQQITL